MSINPQVSSLFPKLKIKRSESGRIIMGYEKSRSSQDLFDFLSLHPAVRVAFNSMVKADFISLERGFGFLGNLLNNAKTSLIFEAKCSCENILDRPHIHNLLDMIGEETKSITCPKCKKVNPLNDERYKICPDWEIKDLLKSFYYEGKIFNISPVKECFKCGHQSIEDSSKKIKLQCEECHTLAHVSMQIFLQHEELKALIKRGQGYWLEWFVWRILMQKFNCEVGICIEEKNNQYEADIIVIHNGKKIFIECKDTTDEGFIKKIHAIKRNFDYYLLVSTSSIHKDALATTQKLLRKKFKYVPSDKIEGIIDIINKLD